LKDKDEVWMDIYKDDSDMVDDDLDLTPKDDQQKKDLQNLVEEKNLQLNNFILTTRRIPFDRTKTIKN
jgi:hypothetical protein